LTAPKIIGYNFGAYIRVNPYIVSKSKWVMGLPSIFEIGYLKSYHYLDNTKQKQNNIINGQYCDIPQYPEWIMQGYIIPFPALRIPFQFSDFHFNSPLYMVKFPFPKLPF
jgi:hypothetical protein